MAAIRRRPSTMICLALSLYLAAAGCSLVAPVESPTGGGNAAGRLVPASGQTAAAGAAAAPSPSSAVAQYPHEIALLLPLSGPAEGVGAAVRDGFLSAYFQADAASRPQVKIYDVAAVPVAAAYAEALAD